MGKYNTIAVIYGSDSSEWEVSCRSGEFTAENINDSIYDVYQIFARFGKWQLVSFRKKNSMPVKFPEGARPEVDKTDFSVCVMGEKVKFDFAYIMQHGAPGETGLLQGYLEMLGIPFSSCGAFVSSVAFDKFSCKSYLQGVDFLKLAPSLFVRKGSDLDAFSSKAVSCLKFPLFVKPTQGGSSFGITKVNDPADLPSAIKYAFSEGPTVLVEQGVAGRELTCGVYFDGNEVKALPVIEIITENDYFDYDAKYNGHSREVCPAQISEAQKAMIQDASVKAYTHLGCKGVVRLDYILCDDGLYFLEANTIPGMTSASLIPKMVREAGLEMKDFLTTLIECA